jgi:transcriptional regulator with XRE-family HTH domain
MQTENEWYGSQQGGLMRPYQARIRELREQRKLSQEQLAHLSHLTLGGYRKVEVGKHSSPRLRTLENIAAALGVKVTDLL